MILIFSWPALDSEILTLETKAGVAMGVRISESGHEGGHDFSVDALRKNEE